MGPVTDNAPLLNVRFLPVTCHQCGQPIEGEVIWCSCGCEREPKRRSRYGDTVSWRQQRSFCETCKGKTIQRYDPEPTWRVSHALKPGKCARCERRFVTIQSTWRDYCSEECRAAAQAACHHAVSAVYNAALTNAL